MACFADVNVSQGSVATYGRCIGIFNTHLTTNLPIYQGIFNLKKMSLDLKVRFQQASFTFDRLGRCFVYVYVCIAVFL